jgi:ubiquinone/menaquinone biosynthesis C-methylase UbiE
MTSDMPWWIEFFDSPDALVLSNFPDHDETTAQVEGIRRLVNLKPGQLACDIGCGYGRHLLPLAEDGCDIVGLDASPMMLRVARVLADEQELQVKLVQAEGQKLPFASGVFDVMLNLFNSFGYMDDAENQTMLCEISRCLKPGGKFLLDTRNKKFQILFAPYRQLMPLADGSSALLHCSYERDTERLVSIWSNPENPKQVYHTASIRLYSPSELEQMLADAGLTVNERYSEYDGTRFVGFERQLIYLCTRPATG